MMPTPEAPVPETALAIKKPSTQPPPRPSLKDSLAMIPAGLVDEFSREVVAREMAAQVFDEDWKFARSFAMSGLFSDIKANTEIECIAQAMTKIQLGRAWNMAPPDAMRYIYFAKGKPNVENEYVAAKLKDAGFDWEVEYHEDEQGTCIGVTLYPSRLVSTDPVTKRGAYEPIKERKNGERVDARVSFMKADADRIKVSEGGRDIPLSEKSTYKAFPRDMYFWRAIARLRRVYATNILSGVMVAGEAEDLKEAPEKPAPAPAPEPMKVAPAEIATPRAARKQEPKPIVEVKAKADEPPVAAEEIPSHDETITLFQALKARMNAENREKFFGILSFLNPAITHPRDITALSPAALYVEYKRMQEAETQNWHLDVSTGKWSKEVF